MLSLDFSDMTLRLKQNEDQTYVFDPVRKKWLVLTPEEHVRQALLLYLISRQGYPASLIAVEKSIRVGDMSKRFDLVVFNRKHEPWMLVECKEPAAMINEATLFQLLNYQRTVQCPFWLLTNGHQHYCADAHDINNIQWIGNLPAYEL